MMEKVEQERCEFSPTYPETNFFNRPKGMKPAKFKKDINRSFFFIEFSEPQKKWQPKKIKKIEALKKTNIITNILANHAIKSLPGFAYLIYIYNETLYINKDLSISASLFMASLFLAFHKKYISESTLVKMVADEKTFFLNLDKGIYSFLKDYCAEHNIPLEDKTLEAQIADLPSDEPPDAEKTTPSPSAPPSS